MRNFKAWTAARRLAERTPMKRNRYVDFLRAVSIGIVVFGHWLVGMPAVVEGELRPAELLHVVPWTQWLTWAFQVMPVFFIVGGYSNAASWKSTYRTGRGFGEWIAARLQRLVGPVVPLLIFWLALAFTAHQLDLSPTLIQTGSRAAFIPLWFLAVYVMAVVATPATYWAWRRFGLVSFWAFVAAAVAVDAMAFIGEFPLIRRVNYAFVWLAVHQLGYLWRDGRLAGPVYAWPWAVGGLAMLIFLVTVASYPISMITVPGQEISNSRPPTVALIALAAFHAGILLSLERPARRWLMRLGPWTATILVNARIMTLYLWHLTVMVVIVGTAMLLGGIGLGPLPGTEAWWLTRPAWLIALLAVTWVFLAIFGRFERTAKKPLASRIPTWRAIIGAIMVSSGLALVAAGGIGDPGPLGVRLWVVLLTLTGIALVLPAGLFQRTKR